MNVTCCQVCGTTDLELVFDAGWLPLVNTLRPVGSIPEPETFYPAQLLLCKNPDCQLVQLGHQPDPKDVFPASYSYRSGMTKALLSDFDNLAHECVRLGRIKSNCGDLVIDVGCFPRGRVVVAPYKQKDIRDVDAGDMVLDADGDFTKVTKKFERGYSGDLVSMKVQGICNREIQATPEHPFLIIRTPRHHAVSKERFQQILDGQKPEWVKAGDLVAGDYCLLPLVNLKQSVNNLDVSDLLDCIVEGDRVYSVQKNKNSHDRVRAHNQLWSLPATITLDEEFGRLLGYYVSEGSGDGRGGAFSFAFHEDEVEYIDDVQSLLMDVLGLPSKTRIGARKSVSVRSPSALGKKLMQAIVGNGAAKKCLPGWVFSAPENFRVGLLKGMFRGDGSWMDRGSRGGIVKYDTVSENLAFQVRFLLFSFGIKSSIIPNKPNGYGKANGLTLWSVRASSSESLQKMGVILGEDIPCRVGVNNKWPVVGGYQLVRIFEVRREKFTGTVYNMETESGSYVMETVVVHNCNDGSLLESFRAQGCAVAGIEPTGAADDAQNKGLFVIRKLFNREVLHWFGDWPRAKLVTACNVFAHMPNVHETVDCVMELMADDGFFVMEVHYLPSMLERLQFDVVYHEHLRYYSLTSLHCLLEQHGLEIVDCKQIPVHGGSVRVTAARKGKYPVQQAVVDMLEVEALHQGFAEEFESFREQVGEVKLSLYDVLLGCDLGETWGIGAPSRAVTLIHHWGLDNVLSRVCELPGSKKIGHCVPGTRIPIVDERELFVEQPPVAIILSWHLADEIAANLRRNGYNGELIKPLPYPRVLR